MNQVILRSFSKKLNLVGAAVSLGQPKKGVEKTPEVLKSLPLSSLFNTNNWDAAWKSVVHPTQFPQTKSNSRIKNQEALDIYGKELKEAVCSALQEDAFLLNIGGDHSIGSSTIAGVLEKHPDLGVIWVDAHGDCNTPDTSPSQNYHGMPLAHIMDLFQETGAFSWRTKTIPPERVALIGIRALDSSEKALMDQHNIKYFTMEEVNSRGIQTVLKDAMSQIDPKSERPIHLSLDVDGIDPLFVPGTGTAVPGGLDIEHVKHVISHLKSLQRWVSMDLVEINFDIEKEKTLETLQHLLKFTFN